MVEASSPLPVRLQQVPDTRHTLLPPHAVCVVDTDCWGGCFRHQNKPKPSSCPPHMLVAWVASDWPGLPLWLRKKSQKAAKPADRQPVKRKKESARDAGLWPVQAYGQSRPGSGSLLLQTEVALIGDYGRKQNDYRYVLYMTPLQRTQTIPISQ